MFNVFDRVFFPEINIHKCHTKYMNNFLDKEGIMKALIILKCYSWLDKKKILKIILNAKNMVAFYVQINVDGLIYEKGNRGYKAAVQNACSKHRWEIYKN